MPWRLLYSLVEANWLQRSMKWIPYFRQVNWFCSLDCTSTLHFIFFSRLKPFFTLYILLSPWTLQFPNWKHQPFHKVQNHEQDLNIYLQIIKILLRQLHQHTSLHFFFRIKVFFHYIRHGMEVPNFHKKNVKWLDFRFCPLSRLWFAEKTRA